jgi:hypothetical protein
MTNKKTAVIEWLFFNKAKPRKNNTEITQSDETEDVLGVKRRRAQVEKNEADAPLEQAPQPPR